MAVIDWADPCARFAALQDAYYQLISGGTESLVRYKGPEGEREVRFATTNLDALKAELRDADTACAIKNGTAIPSRRFAIRGGAQSRTPRGGWWDIGTGQYRP